MSGTSKTGLYVCTGCGIGNSIDPDALIESLGVDAGIEVRTSGAFCLEDSELIRSDVAAGGVDAVVIAACSPRVKRQVFRFPATSVRRVNLREQVAWSHPPGEEATQELAVDMVKMGLAAAQHHKPAKPFTADHARSVLVVGAGPAGLAAAEAAADAGFQVIVAEHEAEPGGFLRRVHAGWNARSTDPGVLEPLALAAVVERAAANPAISLRTSTEVLAVDGQPGRFTVQLGSAMGNSEVVVGAVVMATGFEPVGAIHFAHYGLGTLGDVITSLDMEDLASRGEGLRRPSDGSLARRVVLLACDGPADVANLPYLGTVASMVLLKQAMYVKEADPEAEVFVVYEDMQTTGLDELYYRQVQQHSGVYLVRGHVREVREGASGIEVMVTHSVLARDLLIEADLVVVHAGMVPSSSPGASQPANLHLGYLQGDAMPVHRGGFVDSNFLCFPFESRRTGIYPAGCVHRGQDIAASRRDGTAAALKAIQVVEKATVGAAVHPRVGDLGYPEFFLQKCTACGRCTQECPFDALELDDQRHPVVNPNRCRRCGICMGACPVQVISFPDYSVAMLSDMQKVVGLPEDDDDKARILVLACENDAYPALDMVGINHLNLPAQIRVAPVRCLGSVNSIVVIDAIQRGYDGVALLGCRSGDDYQCHFIGGSGLLGDRMSNVRETLGRLALEEERVQVIETSIADARRLPEVLGGLVEELVALGPNPMKGF